MFMNNKSALLKTNAGEYIPRRKCTLNLGTFSPRETYLGTGMFSPREYVPGYVGMFFEVKSCPSPFKYSSDTYIKLNLQDRYIQDIINKFIYSLIFMHNKYFL